MYYTRKIPAPFQCRPKGSPPVQAAASIPIDTPESSPKPVLPKAQPFSPFAAFLLLDLFSKKKGDV